MDAFTAGGVKPDDRKNYLDKALRERIAKLTSDPASPAHVPALVMSLWWKEPPPSSRPQDRHRSEDGGRGPRRAAEDPRREQGPGQRQSYLAARRGRQCPDPAPPDAVEAVADSGDAGAIKSLLTKYAQLPADLRPMTVNALTHSRAAAQGAAGGGRRETGPRQRHQRQPRPPDGILHNAEVDARIERAWGKVKTERDPSG